MDCKVYSVVYLSVGVALSVKPHTTTSGSQWAENWWLFLTMWLSHCDTVVSQRIQSYSSQCDRDSVILLATLGHPPLPAWLKPPLFTRPAQDCIKLKLKPLLPLWISCGLMLFFSMFCESCRQLVSSCQGDITSLSTMIFIICYSDPDHHIHTKLTVSLEINRTWTNRTMFCATYTSRATHPGQKDATQSSEPPLLCRVPTIFPSSVFPATERHWSCNCKSFQSGRVRHLDLELICLNKYNHHFCNIEYWILHYFLNSYPLKL